MNNKTFNFAVCVFSIQQQAGKAVKGCFSRALENFSGFYSIRTEKLTLMFLKPSKRRGKRTTTENLGEKNHKYFVFYNINLNKALSATSKIHF